MHSVVSSSNFYPGNTAIGDYIGRALEGMRNNTPVYERVVSDLWRAKISGPNFFFYKNGGWPSNYTDSSTENLDVYGYLNNTTSLSIL